MNNLKNDILYHFYGKKKTFRGLLLLHRGLRTCFSQTIHNVPNSKQNPFKKAHIYKACQGTHKLRVLLHERNSVSNVKFLC